MSGQLYVEAFGTLDRESAETTISRDDAGGSGHLLNVFDDLGEMMGWSGHGDTDRPFLWEMHEAEVTHTDDDRIGFINVSVGFGSLVRLESALPPPLGGKRYADLGWHRRSWDPALVLPPLIQCFYDSLARYGRIELTGIQIFGIAFAPRVNRLQRTPNWFTFSQARQVNAIVAFDAGLLGDQGDSSAIAEGLTVTSGPFRFGPLVNLPEEYALQQTNGQWPFMMSVAPYEKGLNMTLPEWSPSAIGYALGMLRDRASRIAPPPENFVMRITRVPPFP